jgi:hypothetical protein
MKNQVKVEKKAKFNSKEVKSIETFFGKKALATIEKLAVKGGDCMNYATN